MAKIPCNTPGCDKPAKLFVKAWCSIRPWEDYRCTRHAARLVRLRARLIVRFDQNVVVRPVTKMDQKNYRRSK